MKRIAMLVAAMSIALCAVAQSSPQGGQQSPPPAGQATQGGQTAPAGQAAPTPGATAPQAKRRLQAKTQPEYDAYNAAVTNKDAASLEKAADDFATKFPDSELRGMLYTFAMRAHQNANNADKTEAMGRKVLSFDGDDPEALVTTAEMITEKTRDSDIDRDQRYDEAMKMAQKALTTVDTNVSVPAGTPQDRLDAYKSGLRSQAYSTMGAIEYSKGNFANAQTNFQKAIDAFPSQPFPADVLRLALALDKQQKYDEALKVAIRAVELSPENTPIGTSARRERDRLQQLSTPPAQPQSQPPKN
ncbi:MAG: tetratricopeptide repeat protein [Terriglobales bacterium]